MSDDENPTLTAARELQAKLSLGENGAKKRRKYSVEKYLSHPQFCRLGSVTNFDKKAFDENFDRIFGTERKPVEYGERDGYTVKRHEGRHEAILLGDEEVTEQERAALKAKMRARLRAAKR